MAPVHPELADAAALHRWADERMEARGLLPRLVRQLASAAPGVSSLRMPAEEATSAPGWDGRMEAGAGGPFVPARQAAVEGRRRRRPARQGER